MQERKPLYEMHNQPTLSEARRTDNSATKYGPTFKDERQPALDGRCGIAFPTLKTKMPHHNGQWRGNGRENARKGIAGGL